MKLRRRIHALSPDARLSVCNTYVWFVPSQAATDWRKVTCPRCISRLVKEMGP